MSRWDIKWSNMPGTDLWIVDKDTGIPIALNRNCSDGDFMDAIEKHHNADIAALEAERDEWKRRCDAIVAMLARGYTAHLREVHANALNIAEGRDNG